MLNTDLALTPIVKFNLPRNSNPNLDLSLNKEEKKKIYILIIYQLEQRVMY